MINGTSWFSVAELSEKLKEKSRKDPSSKMNQYQKEYLEIVKQTPKFSIGNLTYQLLSNFFKQSHRTLSLNRTLKTKILV